jgi:signal transduction histidine kinase
MARKKRTSRTLEKAELRVAGLSAIASDLASSDLNIDDISDLIQQLRTKLNAYNGALALLDSSQSEVDELEKTLSSASERLLTGVAFKYGKDSREYEMAGGVRKSDRIRKATSTRLKSVAQSKAVAG